MSSMVEHALAYAARGFAVLPLHEVVEGKCTCGAEDCFAPGKHPRTRPEVYVALSMASVDPAVIERWWKGWPTANIGIATGKASGVWVLNVSPEGASRLADLEEAHGSMPRTMTAVTGGGARHLYFLHSPHLKNLPQGIFGDTISFMGDGRFVVAPPSVHQSGKRYEFEEGLGLGTKLAPVPSWVSDAQKAHAERALSEFHKLTEVIKGASSEEKDEARLLYNRHNGIKRAPWIPFPEKPGPCPICPGLDTFKCHPSIPNTWVCASPQHTVGGKRKGGWFMGDVLDIDAAQRSRTPLKHLEMEGYYGAAVKVAAFQKQKDARMGMKMVSSNPNPEPRPARESTLVLPPAPKETNVIHLKVPQTNSFASLCDLLANPNCLREVVGDRPLERNAMSGLVTLGRQPIQQEDILDIRYEAELCFHDKDGHGLQFSDENIEKALVQVGSKRKYHPVQEYLSSLKWDGTPRVPLVPRDILHADSPANRAIFMRWAISAVQRAFEPGCRAEMMLVLVGDKGGPTNNGEGLNKSSFFRELGKPWFSDTKLNVHVKDGLEQIRAVWIYEWSEMTALTDARMGPSVKAFVTSAVDNYRPSYERHARPIPRGCVFGGTSNVVNFKNELSGDRRFPTIEVTQEVNQELLIQWKDQIWAEAVALWRSGQQAYFTPEENLLVFESQKQFQEALDDVWMDSISSYLRGKDGDSFPVTVTGILEDVVGIETAKMEHKHSIRVSKILRALGWEQSARKKVTGGSYIRLWSRTKV